MKGEGRWVAGVSAGAGADAGQAVDAGLDRLVGEFQIHHIGDDGAAAALHHLHDRLRRTECGDDDVGAVGLDDAQVLGQSGVGAVRDQVDRPRGRKAAPASTWSRIVPIHSSSCAVVRQLGVGTIRTTWPRRPRRPGRPGDENIGAATTGSRRSRRAEVLVTCFQTPTTKLTTVVMLPPILRVAAVAASGT